MELKNAKTHNRATQKNKKMRKKDPTKKLRGELRYSQRAKI